MERRYPSIRLLLPLLPYLLLLRGGLRLLAPFPRSFFLVPRGSSRLPLFSRLPPPLFPQLPLPPLRRLLRPPRPRPPLLPLPLLRRQLPLRLPQLQFLPRLLPCPLR